MKPEALPMVGSDPALLSQSSKPGGTAWTQDIDRVVREHLEADSSSGREPVTVPGAKVPGKRGEAQIAQADLNTVIDASWIMAADELGSCDLIMLYHTYKSHHRSTQFS